MRPTRKTPLPIACLALLLLTSCRSANPPLESPGRSGEKEAAARACTDCPHKEIHWARNSAERRASYWQAYRLAGEMLNALAAELEPGTWAVALDADETVIDNSLYQKERAAIGESFSAESWTAWVARQEAPPLPGALWFLGQIQDLGGKIAIVTNRNEKECPDTELNFQKYAIPYDVILCKRGGESRKEPRWESIEAGTASENLPALEILMWLGDNIEDFPNLSQAVRDKSAGAFERFGVDFFVLPNPMYGSWQKNPAE